jgi:hypothetical protein
MVRTVVAVCDDLIVVADSTVRTGVADSKVVHVTHPKPIEGDGLSDAEGLIEGDSLSDSLGDSLGDSLALGLNEGDSLGEIDGDSEADGLKDGDSEALSEGD